MHGRIVGGSQADDGEYPSYVHARDGYLCGGTLIYKDIVLTAAHCAEAFPVGVTVYIGAVDISGTDDETNTVAEVYQHPDYNKNGQEENDILLLKLESASSSPVVTLNTNPSIPSIGSTVDAIGFGTTSENGSVSAELLEVQFGVYDFQICSNNLGGTQYANTQICAGDDGKDTCQGDSGGPLFVAGTNVQVALVSYGAGCGRPGLPGINTKVSAFLEYIEYGICNLSSDPPDDCPADGGSSPPPTDDTTCSGLFCCDA